jgi:ABC-2 type transport system ATP-binding protein
MRSTSLQTLIESVSSTGITVIMLSHLIGELARVCDHLVVIRDGRTCLAGELDELRSEHHWVAGPAIRRHGCQRAFRWSAGLATSGTVGFSFARPSRCSIPS